MKSELQKLLQRENVDIVYTEGTNLPRTFQLGSVPISYDIDWLVYQRLYLETSGIDVQILDFCVVDKNKEIMAYFPLEYQNNRLSSGGGPVLLPLFKENITRKIQVKIGKSILRVLTDLKKQFDFEVIKLEINVDEKFLWSDYQSIILADSLQKHTVEFHLIIDLKKPEEHLWSGVRKSYRNLINKSREIWHTELITKDNFNNNVWNEFRSLHYEASGKKYTRDLKTWNLQKNMLCNDRAFLSIIRDPLNKRLIGCGFFQINKKTSFYASAAYDRSLFSKPLGHLVQWNAILYMKSKNIDTYYIGRYFTNNDLPRPTEKELNISKFKKGFTDQIMLKIIATV